MPLPQNIVRFLGRYSQGLRLASEHGAASGVVVEYAYRNEPHGSGALGRWIDRTFLGARAWDDVRRRVEKTKATVAEIIAERRARGAPTVILDVASGSARYLRELAQEQGGNDVAIVCCDRDPRQVMHGRQLVAAEALPRFTFSVGDATDASSYLTNHDPDIVLAIDLFPHFHQDEAVRTVMRLAFEHLTAGGGFLCTTVVRPHTALAAWPANGAASRLVVRSADRIAQWLQAAGFVNVATPFILSLGVGLIGWKPSGHTSDARTA
jgi:SAM-dependent methyltransferase